jgi:hypothetical protein
MGSGAGGIQWNASTKYIQLLSSDGSTWINWKYYDPTRSFEIVASNSGPVSTLSYTCEYNGYYAAVASSIYDQRFSAPSSTGTLMYSRYPGSSANHVAIFNCTIGQTINAYGNSYSCQVVLYIGSGYSGVSLLSATQKDGDATLSISTSSVKGLLIGMRVSISNSVGGTQILSESDNYKAVSVNNNNLGNPAQIDCLLSSQIETVSLKETFGSDGSNYGTGFLASFQLT